MHDLETPSVLFVDDEPTVLDAYEAAFAAQQLEVLTAESGSEALSILSSTPIDVVVSDENMAPMSGSTFLRLCRERFPDTERIVLTGHASLDATMSAINDARVVAFLTKPCGRAEIAEAIESALAIKAQRVTADRKRAQADSANSTLDEALANTEVWYQPILDRDGTVRAHEALLRPQTTALPTPVSVVESATRLDRHADLDRRVRRLVGRDLDRGRLSTDVFINVLPKSLTDPALAADDDPLQAHRDRVAIEVTERAHLRSLGDIQPTVERLRELGHRIVIDDLGAGYSGLTSIALLRPDIVKFDLELVRDVHSDEARTHLVGALVDTCHDLGMLALAEGIETPEELAALRRMGFDLYQGYLLGKPAPLLGD